MGLVLTTCLDDGGRGGFACGRQPAGARPGGTCESLRDARPSRHAVPWPPSPFHRLAA